MSSIRTICPDCISPIELDPTEILLMATPPGSDIGSYAYYCRTCERVTVAPVAEAGFALLVSAGVNVERHDSESRPPQAAYGLTVDDLIDFHLLLETQDWFTQLLRQH
jgi:hypothetical protein